MQSDRQPPTDEEIAVRLQWPTDPVGTTAPPPSPQAAEPSSPPAAAPLAGATPVHAAEVMPPSSDPARPGRALVEAYDRLGDRVLERLRALREDVDADLAGVRSELASLRQAVDDVGDRVQLRQLRATVDELRGDVSGLRRAVLEWPELEQVSSDVASLRADLSEVLSRLNADPADDRRSLDEVRSEIKDLRRSVEASMSLPTLAPLIEEVVSLRDEVSSLRRRISLRAEGSSVELNEEQMDRLIRAVETRVGGGVRPGQRPHAR